MTPDNGRIEAPFRIRSAAERDIPAVVDLWRDFMAYHRRLDPYFTLRPDGHRRWARFLRKNLADPDWEILLAVADPSPIGYCMIRSIAPNPVLVSGRIGFIQDLAVAAAHRRRKIGTALVRKAETWFRRRGVVRIELDVAARNPASQLFWRQMGFAPHLERLAKPATEA